MSSGMMDTAPGGESTQYESIQTVTKPHSKQGGQIGESETQVDAVDQQQEQAKAERGEKTAENVRYGQNISEGGMGGMTTEGQGSGNQAGGFGGTEAQTEAGGDRAAAQSREAQDYGPGSGVGA